jgi:hypothetical protein
MRRIGHPPSALSRDRRTRGASGVVRGHVAPAPLAVVRAELRLAFRHVPASIRHHARGVVSVDASHSGKYGFDLLLLAPPKKTPNKASHPTPTRWVVPRLLASILILGLHSLRASIRGGWTQRSANKIVRVDSERLRSYNAKPGADRFELCLQCGDTRIRFRLAFFRHAFGSFVGIIGDVS